MAHIGALTCTECHHASTLIAHRRALPDLLGFGRSDKPAAAYTLELYAHLVERIVDDLDLAAVTLVGACVGSAPTLRYAYEHPDRVRGLSWSAR